MRNTFKTAISQLFFDFRKNCPYDSNEVWYRPSTLYYGHLCVISSNSYCWDVRNIAKINPKMANNKPFLYFSVFLKNCPYDSDEIFCSHSTPYYGPFCATSSISYCWDVRNIAKINPKMAEKESFFDFFDFRCLYDSNENFYSHFLHYSMVLCVQFQ